MKTKYKIPITIAGIMIGLESPLSAAELRIQKRLGPFLYPINNPLLHLRLRWEECANPPEPKGKIIFDPGVTWKMYKDSDYYYASILYKEEEGELFAKSKAMLRANPEWNDMTLTEHRSGAEWMSMLNLGASEIIIKCAINFTGGVLFHASSLDDNGRGLVFTGHSGAGKSTLADLWQNEPGVKAMSDDRTAIQIEQGMPVCYGTPWGGSSEIANNHCAPLSALFILEKSCINEIEIITPSRAAPLLAARAFLPYWGDSSFMTKALVNLNRILEHIPVYLLRFRPEKKVIPMIRSVIC